MAESSLRAARPERRGGLRNALFVVAAADRPPAELTGIAAELAVTMPWGSLLRGALANDDARDAATGIAALVAPGGTVRVLVSIDPRDRLAVPPLTADAAPGLATRWCCHGLTLAAFEPADAAVIAATGSSWARRLAAGRDRAVWRLDLVKPGGGALARHR